MVIQNGYRRSRGTAFRTTRTSLRDVGTIEEYAALPLKEPVLEKWLYKNAQRFFRLE
jgi:hypothetical protein